MSLKIGVVGATGMVGEAFMDLLTRKKFPVSVLKPFASERSVGLKVSACGKSWPVESLSDGSFKGLDVVFFSSGDDVSKEWAPKAVEDGAFAIDNSAAYRMDQRFPLIVPEVNGHRIPKKSNPTIIANPNCSTIQLVVALQALRPFGLESVRVASYQSVSGAGKLGREELLKQTTEFINSGKITSKPETFAHPIAFNCIPHIGSFSDDGFSSEEHKIMRETKKIMELELSVSAFTVRVPALNSHSEAVWVTLNKNVNQEEILNAFQKMPGLKLITQSTPSAYPTALEASEKEPVFVGRIHRDLNDPKTWLMWVVADNIWKGAALNGLQIAERIFDIK
jgi:aspartate-semialdehyde dehydrogenase